MIAIKVGVVSAEASLSELAYPTAKIFKILVELVSERVFELTFSFNKLPTVVMMSP